MGATIDTRPLNRRGRKARVYEIGERLGREGVWVVVSSERPAMPWGDEGKAELGITVACPACKKTVVKRPSNLNRAWTCGCTRDFKRRAGQPRISDELERWLRRQGNRDLLRQAKVAFALDFHYAEDVANAAQSVREHTYNSIRGGEVRDPRPASLPHKTRRRPKRTWQALMDLLMERDLADLLQSLS